MILLKNAVDSFTKVTDESTQKEASSKTSLELPVVDITNNTEKDEIQPTGDYSPEDIENAINTAINCSQYPNESCLTAVDKSSGNSFEPNSKNLFDSDQIQIISAKPIDENPSRYS